MPKSNTLFTQAASYSITDGATGLLRIALAAAFTRQLIPEEFGVLSIIYVTVTCGVILAQWGMPGAVMAELRKNDSAWNNRALDHGLWMNILFCLILCGGLAAFSPFMPLRGGTEVWVTAAVWIIGQVIMLTPMTYLRFRAKAWSYCSVQIVRILTTIVLIGIPVLKGNLSVVQIVRAETISAIAACLMAFLLAGYFPKPSWPEKTRNLLKYATPLGLVSLAFFVIDSSDRYLITFFLGDSANGFYSLAGRIAFAGSLIAEGFNLTWAPHYLRESGRVGINRKAIRILFISLLLFGFMSLTLPIASAIRVGDLFIIHPSYHLGLFLVPALVIQYFFRLALYVVTPVYLFRRRNWHLLWILSACAVLNVAGNAIVLIMLPHLALHWKLLIIACMTDLAYALAAGLALLRSSRLAEDFGSIRRPGAIAFFAAILLTLFSTWLVSAWVF